MESVNAVCSLSDCASIFWGGGSRLSRLMLRVDGRSIRQLVKRNEKREDTIEHARGSKRRKRRKGGGTSERARRERGG